MANPVDAPETPVAVREVQSLIGLLNQQGWFGSRDVVRGLLYHYTSLATKHEALEAQVASLLAEQEALKAERDKACQSFPGAELHVVCGNQEHDPANGKIAGYCKRCQLPWPCPYVPESVVSQQPEIERLRAAKDTAEAEVARLTGALRMIANLDPCVDNLMSDKDIARAALAPADPQEPKETGLGYTVSEP